MVVLTCAISVLIYATIILTSAIVDLGKSTLVLIWTTID